MTRITPIKTPEQIKQDKIFFHTPFFLAPSKTIFADRATRFQDLAKEDKTDWHAYLQLLASVSEAQQVVLDEGLAAGDFAIPEGIESRTILPLADGGYVPASFYTCFEKLLAKLDQKVSSTVLNPLRALEQTQAEQLAQATLKQELSAEQKPMSLWAHAALQIIWTAWAQQLQEDDVPIVEQRSHCPCCGSEAVASVIMISSDLANLRYLHCPTCNSRWNALRAKCTFCGDQSSMALQEIEEAQSGALKGARAETCDHCHSYRKMFMLQHQQFADPVADDLASLALDILIGEEGYERGGHNPFLLGED